MTIEAVYADSTAFYALLSDDDAKHDEAVEIAARLRQQRAPLVTTNYVVIETVTLLQRRLGFSIAIRFVHETLRPVEVSYIDEGLHRAALEDWSRQRKRNLSTVDCISFAFMRANAIENVFTFDRNFAAAGFALV